MRRFRLGAALVLPLLCAACGFQLRGDVVLPPAMQSTYIAYAGNDPALLRDVARALSLSGADVARSPAEATAILRLPAAGVSRRVLARDSRGRPREYELSASFVYSVVTSEGQTIVGQQQTTQYGNVLLDPEEPLANAGEVQRAVQALREDATWEMLRRIASAEKSPRADSGNDDIGQAN